MAWNAWYLVVYWAKLADSAQQSEHGHIVKSVNRSIDFSNDFSNWNEIPKGLELSVSTQRRI
jgi:hypothetical protein